MKSAAWKSSLARVLKVFSSPAAFVLYLLALCIVVYGPFLTQLGFFWDDFPIMWIGSTMGRAGLEQYFSTNRPVLGMLYQITTPLLGPHPMSWQVLALVLRWLTGVLFWALLRQVWPARPRLAAWAVVLFLVYPGFSHQFISFVYTHFFIALNLFLLSQLLMLLALKHTRFFWPLTIIAVLASAINLLAMEYFFLLDLLRPLLIWIVLSETVPNRRDRALRALRTWLPYLALLLGVIIWRSFFFGFQNYQPTLAGRLSESPLSALVGLVITAFRDVWMAGALAWLRPFQALSTGSRLFNPLYYWAVVGVAGVMSIVYLLLYNPSPVNSNRKDLWQPAALALIALFVAGGPFWLTDLPVGLSFPNDRFTLPFILGSGLFLAALLLTLPGAYWVKAPLLGVLVAFSAGIHFQNAAVFRQDWNAQRNLFWQLTWRAPGLQPGTLLLSNELPLTHYSDNSLSAPLNWIYDPQNSSEQMPYLLYYPTVRKQAWLEELIKGQPIQHDYLATTFTGSSSQVLVVYYEPPGCLRVLDPEVDLENQVVPLHLRSVLPLSRPSLVLPSNPLGDPLLPETVYGPEIPHGWCYYYEKADLARQSGDWEEVVRLGEKAFAGDDYPNDPSERFPFIEGYAHTGDWARAVELSVKTREITQAMQIPLCRLWQRIGRETPPSDQQRTALQEMQNRLACEAQ